MATAKAYGSITIVDIGDLGTLSVYPESNQPTSVIYDPNQNGGLYNPSWATNNLKLTPTIYYGGTQIDATNAAVTVTWERQVGSGNQVSLVDGESMNNSKQLIVNKNVLTSSAPIITYVCIVKYKEPQTGKELGAKGQISFSLISQPTTIKSCSIVGESVFLYGSDKSLKGAESITLNAKLSNCDVDSWQYKDASGAWVIIDGQLGVTLTINAKNHTSYFVNNVATIRLNTNVNGVYDVHSITQIYDGAPGDSVLSVALSNEDMYVPCYADGTVVAGGLDNAKTNIMVYHGNDDVTAKASISTTTSGVSGYYNEANYTYVVDDISAMNGTVTFTVVYDGKTINKIFYLTKLLAGADGVTPTIVSLKLDTVVLHQGDNDSYTPNTILARAVQSRDVYEEPYSGRFKIYADTECVYTSPNDEDSVSYQPSGSHATYKVELYVAGRTSGKPIDSQTIIVAKDGEKGEAGTGGLSYVLGNYVDSIPCTEKGLVMSACTLEIPFAAYRGIERLRCEATLPEILPNGMKVLSNEPASGLADGRIKISVSKDANLGGTLAAYDTGTINITLSATNDIYGEKGTKVYTWTKNRQGASGADSVLLRTYAPNGNIINNGENDVQLSAILSVGASEIKTGEYSCKWFVFNNGSSRYDEITQSNTMGGHTGYTTSTLTVPRDAVHSYASYCVEVTYNGKQYKDYISVQDKTDPIQVEVFSTLGDKITNSVGVGCVYARVFQTGTELDELQNLEVSIEEPQSPLYGDVWAHIDQTTKSVILKKYTNEDGWTAFTLSNTECNYKWRFGDYNGNTEKLNGASESTDKFLYIQGSYITKKMQFNLEVTTNA